MSIQRKIRVAKQRRALRVRRKLDATKPRLSVFRSAQHIYVQLIDDQKQHTLASCSSRELKNVSGSKKEIAHAVGRELAQKAISLGITEVVFDRGSFLFHGRIQSVAEGAREAGLRV